MCAFPVRETSGKFSRKYPKKIYKCGSFRFFLKNKLTMPLPSLYTRMNGYRNASYVGFVLYMLGIVVVVYGLYNRGIEKKLDPKGLKAKGKVYDLTVIEPYRKAMVEFKNEKGKTIRFEDKLFWNHSFKKYTKGQEVEVIYDPADPIRTAVINEFFQRATAPWWPVIVGGILFLVGFIMRKIMLRKAKELDARMGKG